MLTAVSGPAQVFHIHVKSTSTRAHLPAVVAPDPGAAAPEPRTVTLKELFGAQESPVNGNSCCLGSQLPARNVDTGGEW